jgi:hypothetical protein
MTSWKEPSFSSFSLSSRNAGFRRKCEYANNPIMPSRADHANAAKHPLNNKRSAADWKGKTFNIGRSYIGMLFFLIVAFGPAAYGRIGEPITILKSRYGNGLLISSNASGSSVYRFSTNEWVVTVHLGFGYSVEEGFSKTSEATITRSEVICLLKANGLDPVRDRSPLSSSLSTIWGGPESGPATFDNPHVTLAGILPKLRPPVQSNSLPEYIYARLSKRTLEMIPVWDRNTNDSTELELARLILRDFSEIIRSGVIYDPQRLWGFRLSSDTRSYIDSKAWKRNRVRLNRMLLEDAFVDGLSRSKGRTLRAIFNGKQFSVARLEIDSDAIAEEGKAEQSTSGF